MTGKQLAAAVGAWIVAATVLGTATGFLFRSTPLVVAVVYATLLAVMLRPEMRDAIALRWTSLKDVALGLGAVGAAYAAVGMVEGLLAPKTWSATLELLLAIGADDGRIGTASAPLVAIIVLRACVLAPLGEELLFRGALSSWLRSRWSTSVAIVVSAVLFSLIHGYAPLLPLTFALGLGWGWVRERSGSTVPSLIAHAVHNAGMLAVSYALTQGTVRLPVWGS